MSTTFKVVIIRKVADLQTSRFPPLHPWLFTPGENTVWATPPQPRILPPSGLLIIPASILVFTVFVLWATDLQIPPSRSLVLYPVSEHSVRATDLQIPPSRSLVLCPESEHSVLATDLQIPPSPSLFFYPGSEHSVWATHLSILGSLPRIRVLCVGYTPPDSPLSILGFLPRIRALCVGYTSHIPRSSGCLLIIPASKLAVMDSCYSPTTPKKSPASNRSPGWLFGIFGLPTSTFSRDLAHQPNLCTHS